MKPSLLMCLRNVQHDKELEHPEEECKTAKDAPNGCGDHIGLIDVAVGRILFRHLGQL